MPGQTYEPEVPVKMREWTSPRGKLDGQMHAAINRFVSRDQAHVPDATLRSGIQHAGMDKMIGAAIGGEIIQWLPTSGCNRINGRFEPGSPIEPYLFHAPAIIDAIYLWPQALDLRRPACRFSHVVKNRANDILL